MRARALTYDYDNIRALFALRQERGFMTRLRLVAAEVGCSIGTAQRAMAGRDHTSARTRARSPRNPSKIGKRERGSTTLPPSHPATINKTTVFTGMVRDIGHERVLKDGMNSGKIGGLIVKGAWKGLHVYTLTLEERATCPVTCHHWSSCYGNAMFLAPRWRHGEDLERAVRLEVAALERKHWPKGFAVRLHTLGDFYSVAYVEMWRELLMRHATMRCFGFTARVDTERDPIALALAQLVREHWPRFAIRFSNGACDHKTTVSIEHPLGKPDDAIICPAQWTESGKLAESCSACALCWSTTRRIAFLRH